MGKKKIIRTPYGDVHIDKSLIQCGVNSAEIQYRTNAVFKFSKEGYCIRMHGSPCVMLSHFVENFDCDLMLEVNNSDCLINLKSFFALFTFLGVLYHDDCVTLTAAGPDAHDVVEKIVEFIKTEFSADDVLGLCSDD